MAVFPLENGLFVHKCTSSANFLEFVLQIQEKALHLHHNQTRKVNNK